MRIYRITARLEAPLALKRDRQSERSETLPSISGTTLRGGLAAVYLQRYGEVDAAFRRLFLNENRCRFGPLDPGPNTYPLTTTACKRQPEEHPKVDQLAYRTALHLLHGSVRDEVHERFRRCHKATCRADLKAHVGFWNDHATQSITSVAPRKHVAAHVGIDRATSTAADGIFYTLEALTPRWDTPEPELTGWIQADDDSRAALRELLDQEDGIVYLGHHRTRGYGRVRLCLAETAESSDPNAKEAWESWSRDLLSFVGSSLSRSMPLSAKAPPSLDAERDLLFAIDLPTGAILVDRFLRCTNDLSAMVSWLPPLPNPDRLFPVRQRPATAPFSGGTLRCVAAMTSRHLLRGWNAAHGLPRQDEWMVARGSVYLYWLHGSTDDREALYERLQQLTIEGVGLRRNEGYGRIIVNDPIHLTTCT